LIVSFPFSLHFNLPTQFKKEPIFYIFQVINILGIMAYLSQERGRI